MLSELVEYLIVYFSSGIKHSHDKAFNCEVWIRTALHKSDCLKQFAESLEGEEYNLIYEYFIAGTPASETEYNNAVNASFDSSRAVRLDENAVPYEEIVQQLEKVYGFNYY